MIFFQNPNKQRQSEKTMQATPQTVLYPQKGHQTLHELPCLQTSTSQIYHKWTHSRLAE